MPAAGHIQAATLDKYIEGWKKWTTEDWMATWSEDCTQKLLPFSLGIGSRSRDETRAFLPKIIESLTNYQLEIYEIVHDAARSKAAIYAISKADTPFDGFKWTNEYAVFLTFTEKGNEIDKMEEMVDTAFYHEFYPKFQKYWSEKEASK